MRSDMATYKPIKYPLTQPSWEQQEGEKPKEYHIFRLFVAHGGSLIRFFRDIKDVEKGQIFCGIEVRYNIPGTYGTLRDLSAARYWFERRDDEESENEQFLAFQYKQIDRVNSLERYEQKDRIEGKILDKLEKHLDNDDINGTQTKELVTAANGMQENKAKDKGEDIQKIKAEVDAAVDANAEVNSTSKVKLDPKQIADRDLELMKNFMDSKQ